MHCSAFPRRHLFLFGQNATAQVTSVSATIRIDRIHENGQCEADAAIRLQNPVSSSAATQSVHPLPPTSTGTWVSHFLWHGTPAHLFEWQRRYRGVRKQISQPRSQRGLKQCTQADESAEQKYVLRKTKFLIRMQPHVRTIPCKTWQALIALSTSPDAFKDDALFCFAGLLLLSSFSYILLVPRSCCFVVWCRHRLPETHPLAHSIAVAPKALLAARCACWRINNPNNVSLIYEV